MDLKANAIEERQNGNYLIAAKLFEGAAFVAMSQDNFNVAIELFEKALDERQGMGISSDTALIHVQLAQLWWDKGSDNSNKSRRELRVAFSQARECRNQLLEAEIAALLESRFDDTAYRR